MEASAALMSQPRRQRRLRDVGVAAVTVGAHIRPIGLSGVGRRPATLSRLSVGGGFNTPSPSAEAGRRHQLRPGVALGYLAAIEEDPWRWADI